MVMVLTFNLHFLMVSYKNLVEMHLYVNIFHDDSQNSNRKIASPDHDKVFRLTEEYQHGFPYQFTISYKFDYKHS